MHNRRCGDWLAEYLRYTRNSESPEIFHFWTGVSTIGSALRRKVWIDMRAFQWTPNFYIILVAPPGVSTKSTTIGVGEDLLTELSGVHFGPSSFTWQALLKALEEAQEAIPLIQGDLDSPLINMSCISCIVGELGTFLDPSNRELIDLLTDMWDSKAGVWKRRTIAHGETKISTPWINLIAGTTPAWLKKHVPEEMIGGGFASRVIFVFSERKRQLVPYPGLVSSSAEHESLKENLIHDLREIESMVGEMHLSPDAIKWGQEWYIRHNENRPVHMASDRFGGYIARKQTHIHKLAIVLSASRSNSLVIERDILEKAERLVTALERDMITVFESIGVAPTARLLHDIMIFIKTYTDQEQPVTQKMLWRYCMNIMSAQEFNEAIDSGVKASYLQVKQVGGDLYFKLLVDPHKLREAQEEME